MERLFIGMDVGGTNLRCAIVNHNGNILERRCCESRIEEGRKAFCERLLLLSPGPVCRCSAAMVTM